MKYINIAAYKFIELSELPALQTDLKAQAAKHHLRGTILLSPEGINLMLTGWSAEINAFKHYLHADQRFNDLTYKETYAETQTFNKLLVKIKKEIIAFGVSEINPVCEQAPYVKPLELKQWLDEGRDIVFLDTRNTYEVAAGTFKQASHLSLNHFRDFPKAAKKLESALKDKTIVTFCTGGIRCEKAALLLQQYGFKQVYQLEGGILGYFAACSDSHYQGSCYVFDARESVTAQAVFSSDESAK